MTFISIKHLLFFALILLAQVSYSAAAFWNSGDAECIKEKVDILIVGAGLSGIAAADRLKEFNNDNGKDITFKVLESDSVVGGRARAAQWLSGFGNPLLKILEGDADFSSPQDYIEQNFQNAKYYNNTGNIIVSKERVSMARLY